MVQTIVEYWPYIAAAIGLTVVLLAAMRLSEHLTRRRAFQNRVYELELQPGAAETFQLTPADGVRTLWLDYDIAYLERWNGRLTPPEFRLYASIQVWTGQQSLLTDELEAFPPHIDHRIVPGMGGKIMGKPFSRGAMALTSAVPASPDGSPVSVQIKATPSAKTQARKLRVIATSD